MSKLSEKEFLKQRKEWLKQKKEQLKIRNEFWKKLYNAFPELFKHKDDKRQSLMYFGIEIDKGWYPIIYELTKKIYDINKKNKDIQTEVVQIKEKFGGLRYYIHSGTDEIFKLIRDAEKKSYETCEICGAPGKLNTKGWYKTLCDKHWNR